MSSALKLRSTAILAGLWAVLAWEFAPLRPQLLLNPSPAHRRQSRNRKPNGLKLAGRGSHQTADATRRSN